MTISVHVGYTGGIKKLEVVNSDGVVVATLEKPGDEYTGAVHDSNSFTLREADAADADTNEA